MIATRGGIGTAKVVQVLDFLAGIVGVNGVHTERTSEAQRNALRVVHSQHSVRVAVLAFAVAPRRPHLRGVFSPASFVPPWPPLHWLSRRCGRVLLLRQRVLRGLSSLTSTVSMTVPTTPPPAWARLLQVSCFLTPSITFLFQSRSFTKYRFSGLLHRGACCRESARVRETGRLQRLRLFPRSYARGHRRALLHALLFEEDLGTEVVF